MTTSKPPTLNIGRVKVKDTREATKKHLEYIYFYQHENKYKNLVKIGKTKQTVKRRVKDQQTSAPDGLKVIGVIAVRDCAKAEAIIHKHFNKYHYNREWFRLSPSIKSYIKINSNRALTYEAN